MSFTAIAAVRAHTTCTARTACAALAAFTALALLPATATGHAQTLPSGVAFGMTVAEVQAAAGPLERIPGARRTAAGAVESLRGPALPVAGVPFEQTYVFARGHLSRVEALAAPPAGTTPGADDSAALFGLIVAWGQRTYGPENRARDTSGEYASWSTPQEDIYVQRTAGAGGTPSVRLVHAERQQRDSDAL
ncbi:MAG: hypothetical protein V4505_19345 [Pseudomonadota bacterium]